MCPDDQLKSTRGGLSSLRRTVGRDTAKDPAPLDSARPFGLGGSGVAACTPADRERDARSGHGEAAGEQPGHVEAAVRLLRRKAGIDAVRQCDGVVDLVVVAAVALRL